MRARHWAAISAALIATIGGCSAEGDAEAVRPEATHDAAPSQGSVLTTAPVDEPTAPAVDESMDDAAICAAYGDVLTIVENADLGLADGRMGAQEHRGWYRLATRVLGRLPSAGDGVVRGAIADLQEVAPAVSAGAGEAPGGVRSTEWYDAQEQLGAACDDLGVPLTISVFTGG